MVDHETVFLSSTLIIMENSCDAVCHAIWIWVQAGRFQKIWGKMVPHIFGMRAWLADPLETNPSTC